MHCPWFFFLLKSNCTFLEYSHQLCLFLYYMLHYTITIILPTYLLVNNASNTRVWPCFGISFLMSLAVMHIIMSEKEQHCFYCLTWTRFSEKTASVCIVSWCFYALFLLGMYLRLGCFSGVPTPMIMLFLFLYVLGFWRTFHQPFCPGTLWGKRVTSWRRCEFCFEQGPTLLYPVCVDKEWIVSMG